VLFAKPRLAHRSRLAKVFVPTASLKLIFPNCVVLRNVAAHLATADVIILGQAVIRSSTSAEESPERIKHTARERTHFLRTIRRPLCKGPLRTAMHLARTGWYLVDRQIDVVSGAGRRATCGGELI